MRPTILTSACLLGAPVRYDGQSKPLGDERLERWRANGQLISTCPECLGGLPTPRPAAQVERVDTQGVLSGGARVLTCDGVDVTEAFVLGAQRALARAREHGCRVALLKQRSPSCGSTHIYDASGAMVPGVGVTTLVLRQAGIEVFGEDQLDELERWLERNAP